ncbi:hypothetical protein P4O66_008354, partial [Electrophorus voltai]
KRVVLGSDKPSDGVATSLRFSSQPSSFSPVAYGNESSGLPSGTIDRSFQEKRQLFESSLQSQKQDTSPIKVSPVSERIKALEALAAKQNDSDWGDGGFPHFRERHYEKSPTEVRGMSSRSSFKKSTISPEQESPESPFEILGDSRRGSDFEDTADWMRAHLPPAPEFSTEESDSGEIKESLVLYESPSKEIKGKDTNAPLIPESFVGVPDEFMDTPTKEAKQTSEDSKESKQDSVEDESEFDLRFLPTAYMWDKQEKPDLEPSDLSGTHDSGIPAPPAGFESSSVPSLPPAPQVDTSVKQQPAIKSGASEPAEILEIDSSGESDDTVIEGASGVYPDTGTDAPDSEPFTGKEEFPHKQVMHSISVPIINVIETEEQILSDDEMEPEEEEEEEEEEDDDDDRYQIMREPAREAPKPSGEHSEVPISISEEAPPKTEEIDSQTNIPDVDIEYPSKHELLKDDISDNSFNQTYPDVKGTSSEVSQTQAEISQTTDDIFRESYINTVKNDEIAEIPSDLPANYENLSNEIESSDIDTYLDHYSSQELALKDQLTSGVFNENDGELDELRKPFDVQYNQNNTVFPQQSFEETLVDEFDETLIESKLDNNKAFEPAPVGISADVHSEPLLPPNDMSNPELEDQCVDLEDQKTITALGSYSQIEEDDYICQPIGGLPSVQENAPAPFPSFHNDPMDKINEVISDFAASDVTAGSMMTNSEKGDLVEHDAPDSQMSPKLISQPESPEPECPKIAATDSFVEFMRECLKSREDEPLSVGPEIHSVGPPSPAMIMDLEQERLTISALKELGSSQEEEDEIPNKGSPLSSKEDMASKSKSEASFASSLSPQNLPNEYQPETSLAKEVEAFDIWVAEAYHLAEHVLAAILTHLSVHDLVHWRDPKKSGVVFGTSLLLLLSLAAFSVISVISYLLLALLCVTISFRIYKSVVQAVQKSNEGHPFKALMEKDVSVPPETFRKHVDQCLTQINRALKQMSRLFLVEDLVDSLKLAVVMWLLTYVGAVFNGITILILADILIFSVPPLYERNKTQIDHYIDVARTHINSTMAKKRFKKLPNSNSLCQHSKDCLF